MTPVARDRHGRARLAATVALAAAGLGCWASASLAASAIVSADLAPGSLTVGTPLVFAGSQPNQVNLDVPVIDARGSGGGWSVYLALSDGGAATDGQAGVALRSVRCIRNSTCTPASMSFPYPVRLGLRDTPGRVAGARSGTGLGGQWVRLRLALPAGASAADLTIRVSVTTGP